MSALLASLFRVKRPTGDEAFPRHMVQSHSAFGLVIFTRCALVLKGYINIPTLKAAFKIRASMHGHKKIFWKNTPTTSIFWTLSSLNAAVSVEPSSQSESFYVLPNELTLASSEKQSRGLPAQRHTSTGKIFLESLCQGIIYNPCPSDFTSHKLTLCMCVQTCRNPEFKLWDRQLKDVYTPELRNIYIPPSQCLKLKGSVVPVPCASPWGSLSRQSWILLQKLLQSQWEAQDPPSASGAPS